MAVPSTGSPQSSPWSQTWTWRVAVSSNMDMVGSVTRRIADFALAAFSAARGRRFHAGGETTAPLPPGTARRLAGRYEEGGTCLELNDLSGALLRGQGYVSS